jgi:predicted phosphodiesterase
MRKLIVIAIVFFSLQLAAQNSASGTAGFIVKPYLQIGSAANSQCLQLLWQTADTGAAWKVQYTTGTAVKWIDAAELTFTNIRISGIEPFTLYNASLNTLVPGSLFTYRVTKNGNIVFTASGKAPKSAAQPFRFVASGDMGAGTGEATEIAHCIMNANPDFVAIAGDIVYDYGLVTDYKTKFWPIYNADKGNAAGAPLMRSIPFVAAVGNHDADTRDLDKYHDALAYYLFWDQPLNGPVGTEGGAFVPLLKGAAENRKAFIDAAGGRYPRMSNFSFNYGNAHWTVLDADTYVDWTDSTLNAWLKKDLADAKDATWRFVLYHHPGFNSSIEHFEQQQMRLLAPVFEKGKVDIVFNGHVHNYQRSFPLQFVPEKKGTLLVGGKDNKTVRGRVVTGKWTLDKVFDGKLVTKPKGVIYIVTGAGGQTLYNPEQQNDPDSWQKFTDKFISTVHSITVVDIDTNTLKLRQLTADGKELDAIEIKK